MGAFFFRFYVLLFFFISMAIASEIIEVREDKILFSLDEKENVMVGDEVEILDGTIIVGRGKVNKVGKRNALAVVSQKSQPIIRGLKIRIEELARRVNEDAKRGPHKKSIYRDCGIGAMIFDETKWAAVSSNIIWDCGLSASSSYSSSEDQCSGKEVSTANFIYYNYAQLEEETATGEGGHLITMLNILGCEATAHQEIIHSLRNDFGKNLLDSHHASKSQLEKAESYYDHVIDLVGNKFVKQCAAI